MCLWGANTHPKPFLDIFSIIHGYKHVFEPKTIGWYRSPFAVPRWRILRKMPFFAQNRYLAEISEVENWGGRGGRKKPHQKYPKVFPKKFSKKGLKKGACTQTAHPKLTHNQNFEKIKFLSKIFNVPLGCQFSSQALFGLFFNNPWI